MPEPREIYLPLGRDLGLRWRSAGSPSHDIAVAGEVVGLDLDEYAAWDAASSAAYSPAQLASAVSGRAESVAKSAIARAESKGVLSKVRLDPVGILDIASMLRLRPLVPTHVDTAGPGAVIGPIGGDGYRLAPAVHEVFVFSARQANLASAVAAVAARASSAGLNDLNVIDASRLLLGVLDGFFELAKRRFAALDVVEAVR